VWDRVGSGSSTHRGHLKCNITNAGAETSQVPGGLTEQATCSSCNQCELRLHRRYITFQMHMQAVAMLSHTSTMRPYPSMHPPRHGHRRPVSMQVAAARYGKTHTAGTQVLGVVGFTAAAFPLTEAP
jgi:hypothetical protein